MDESKYLICHYSKNKEDWYDATSNVVFFAREHDGLKVKFKNSDNFCYVSYKKMFILTNPVEVDFGALYHNGVQCYNVKKLLLFNNTMFKIFYNNGNTEIAFFENIRVVKDFLKENKKAANIMSYYKQVVAATVQNEDDSFMVSQFEKISYVNGDSVLALYLQGVLAKVSDAGLEPVIGPFNLNMSQIKALQMAFSNRISIIEGPPGTGKTQTILNIISNAIINDKTVAIVSNNNAATDNIFEKLAKNGYSFICAPLGNKENVEQFFTKPNKQKPVNKYVDVNIKELNDLYLKLPAYFAKENEQKKLIGMRDAISLEYKYFLDDNKTFSFEKYKIKKIKIASAVIQEAIIKLKEKEKIGFWARQAIKHKVKIKRLFKQQKEDAIIVLQKLYYLATINHLTNEINRINDYMKGQTFAQKTQKYKDLSNTYFNNKVIKIYQSKSRSGYTIDNYKKEFRTFVKDYPVILSSTYALAQCSQSGFLYDYLIVDEASQVNMASAILSMQIAKNIIVVGDIKQLPQIDDNTFKEKNKALLSVYKIDKAYSYHGHSIMSSLLALYGDSIPKQMLCEHYRCAPEIIDFCNKEFYDDKLIIHTNKNKTDKKTMLVVKTQSGNHAKKNPSGSGLYNQREIDEMIALIKPSQINDIGIITPYRYQAECIEKQLSQAQIDKEVLNNIEASTIHKFQGREKKIIIFSSVVNEINDFVGNDNLINVAVSRAVEQFILITSDKIIKSKTGVLADLINYISYHERSFGEVKEGKIKSIYDILYSDYEKQLIEFRKKYPSKDYDTENITKEVLKQILQDNKYKNLWFRMHVSLRDFIKYDNNDLTTEELQFYKNPYAHVDFLLYNKMSKKPILAIEVDGVSFHEQQNVQLKRDAKKNTLLAKANIPLLRLKTNESNEETRIINFIDSILVEHLN